jgi:hypothetical protein
LFFTHPQLKSTLENSYPDAHHVDIQSDAAKGLALDVACGWILQQADSKLQGMAYLEI